MAGGGPLELWNHRSMQILVLLSLGLQVVLFVFAGIRRREAFPVRRLLLWLAYLMADSTAVYAVGHLSFSSTVREHQLVAFWAPFLLLHLGGPDNITAYALQDNQLWLRHLQILVVQVLGAAYVIHKNIDGGSSGRLLRLASGLMFAVGFVKYGERTWALKCGTLESIGASVKTQPPAIHKHSHRQDEASDEEFLVRRAHSLFHVCKRAIVDSSVIEKDSVEGQEQYTTKMMRKVELWALMEIELSLMYDVLYTKAAVVHTAAGYLVRVVSPLTIAASLVLFQLTPKDSHIGADVAITYVLLGGALFMETTSLVNALGSSWTFAFLSTTRWRWLRYVALCNGRWDSLRRRVVSLHHLVKGGFPGGSSTNRYKSRRWSYIIGQYNMLHLCTRPADTLLTSPLLGRLAGLRSTKSDGLFGRAARSRGRAPAASGWPGCWEAGAAATLAGAARRRRRGQAAKVMGCGTATIGARQRARGAWRLQRQYSSGRATRSSGGGATQSSSGQERLRARGAAVGGGSGRSKQQQCRVGQERAHTCGWARLFWGRDGWGVSASSSNGCYGGGSTGKGGESARGSQRWSVARSGRPGEVGTR
ncbi:uncharacterized protein LOC125518587 [Triticum urartu]|uniref:uncharacterized protein LOC125518587 n=1 Tax=Triticum urartu TaxID=4572 RepID=UPI00204394DE|nr:uncharacterized protein LOC125518587 [Triticum urartu]